MTNYNLAIEIGSSNTTIYMAGIGVVLKEPTIIAVNVENKNINVESVGVKAKKLIGKTNNTIEIINPVVEGEIVNFNMCQLMLSEFIKKVFNNKIIKPRLKAIFVVPCGLNLAEKQKYINLAYAVNIASVELVYTSVCGLIGMEVEQNDPHSHMIVSLGGGITDIAVVNNNKILRGATINVGGSGIDYNISNAIKESYNINLEIITIEQIRMQIGTLLQNDISAINVIGNTVSNKNRQEVRIYSSDIQPIMVKAFNRIAESIEAVLNMCSSEVLSDISKFGIYVCGGLSYVTGVEKFLSHALKLPVYIAPDGDSAVINGAGNLLNNPNLLNSLIKN